MEKVLGWLIGSGVAAALVVATLNWAWGRAEESGYAKAAVVWEQHLSRLEHENGRLQAQLIGRQISALEAYIRTRDVTRVLELRSRDEVFAYAQTDAGRAPCLAPDRVRGIATTAEALGFAGPARGDPAAAGAGARGVPDDAAGARR